MASALSTKAFVEIDLNPNYKMKKDFVWADAVEGDCTCFEGDAQIIKVNPSVGNVEAVVDDCTDAIDGDFACFGVDVQSTNVNQSAGNYEEVALTKLGTEEIGQLRRLDDCSDVFDFIDKGGLDGKAHAGVRPPKARWDIF